MPSLDEFGYHEVIDRTHLLLSMLDDHIVSHPVVCEHQLLEALAEEIEGKLTEFYKFVSTLSDNKFNTTMSIDDTIRGGRVNDNEYLQEKVMGVAYKLGVVITIDFVCGYLGVDDTHDTYGVDADNLAATLYPMLVEIAEERKG